MYRGVESVMRLSTKPSDIPRHLRRFSPLHPRSSPKHLHTSRHNRERERVWHTSPTDITIDANVAVEEQQERDFRTWQDSTGLHWQHAALAFYKNGIVHLSSSEGAILEIHEDKLCQDDLIYLQSQDVYKQAQGKVTFRPFYFPLDLLI